LPLTMHLQQPSTLIMMKVKMVIEMTISNKVKAAAARVVEKRVLILQCGVDCRPMCWPELEAGL
jgi:hypothetical protein